MDPTTPSIPQNNSHRTIPVLMISVLVLIFVTILLYAILSRSGKSPEQAASEKNVVSPSVAQVIAEKGRMYLKFVNVKPATTLSDTVSLIIYADSNNESITGYDAVVKYDSTKATFLSAKSLQPTYDIFKQTKNGVLAITGVKKLSATSSVFKDSQLIELSFKPLKIGEASFTLEFVPSDKTESNLITEGNKDILGEVQGVQVAVSP